MLSEAILRFVIRMPRAYDRGVNYIIRRNLWFQCINTLLISLMICLYRHFVLSSRLENNRLSWSNFFETLVIIAFCSFAIGLYWRYKFRSRYLEAELEETRKLNEQLQAMSIQRQESASNAEESPAEITLKGTTSEAVMLQINNLLYIEAVGNYVKVYHLRNGQVRTDMLRATLKQLEDDLCAYTMIVRCHRAFLVNLGQVEQIVSHSGSIQLVIRHCKESIPVSRSNVLQIKEVLKGI